MSRRMLMSRSQKSPRYLKVRHHTHITNLNDRSETGIVLKNIPYQALVK